MKKSIDICWVISFIDLNCFVNYLKFLEIFILRLIGLQILESMFMKIEVFLTFQLILKSLVFVLKYFEISNNFIFLFSFLLQSGKISP